MSNQSSLSKDLTPEEKRQLLSKLLDKKAKANQKEYPLSYAQQAMWFLYELAPESSAYNTGFAARILGDINLPMFKESFHDLIERHTSLRTNFKENSGTPTQQVSGHRDLHFDEIDANGWDEIQVI